MMTWLELLILFKNKAIQLTLKLKINASGSSIYASLSNSAWKVERQGYKQRWVYCRGRWDVWAIGWDPHNQHCNEHKVGKWEKWPAYLLCLQPKQPAHSQEYNKPHLPPTNPFPLQFFSLAQFTSFMLKVMSSTICLEITAQCWLKDVLVVLNSNWTIRGNNNHWQLTGKNDDRVGINPSMKTFFCWHFLNDNFLVVGSDEMVYVRYGKPVYRELQKHIYINNLNQVGLFAALVEGSQRSFLICSELLTLAQGIRWHLFFVRIPKLIFVQVVRPSMTLYVKGFKIDRTKDCQHHWSQGQNWPSSRYRYPCHRGSTFPHTWTS